MQEKNRESNQKNAQKEPNEQKNQKNDRKEAGGHPIRKRPGKLRAAFLLIFSAFIKPVFVNGRFSEGSRHAAAAFFGRLRCQIMPMAKPMTAGSSQPRFLSNSGRLAAAN